MGASPKKKKATDKEHATQKAQQGRAGSPKVPASMEQANHGRFPGERALTGEDRPANKAGQKKGGKA